MAAPVMTTTRRRPPLLLSTLLLLLALLALLLQQATAECPNDCSGHGECGLFDQCECHRNWQAADCSERTCPFGLAHVDSPKGDLDGSASALGGINTVVQAYDVYGAWGTTELYPAMRDSEGTAILTETAHAYAECSNKGLCDRKMGLCKCFAGYEGTSCQRASCPNDCSGRGTCHSIEYLAKRDHGNPYTLWDREASMGCLCDAGYEGPDCSLRQCKVGIDPLYLDTVTTASVASWVIHLADPADADVDNLAGSFALTFFDVWGEDYVTAPITHQDDTNYCPAIQAALEALPNGVVPPDSVTCSYARSTSTHSVDFTLTFTGNPGPLKPPQVKLYLDGTRPTFHGANLVPAIAKVTSAGSVGEFVDYFPTHCEGVTAKVTNHPVDPATENAFSVATLQVATAEEARLLKQCLGDADGNMGNNVGVENWDFGTWEGVGNTRSTPVPATKMFGRFPHAIKLVRKERPFGADYIHDAGHVFLAWYDETAPLQWNLLSRYPAWHDAEKENATALMEYHVFTTDGTAEQVLYDNDGDGSFVDVEAGPVVGRWAKYDDIIYTNVDASCAAPAATRLGNCLRKGDLLFLPAGGFGNARTTYPGDTIDTADPSLTRAVYSSLTDYTGMFYKVVKIWAEPVDLATKNVEDRYRIQVDKGINWDGSELGLPWGEDFENAANAAVPARTGYQVLFKFTPGVSSYEYVSECSGRGACDRGTGLCSCFKGYSNDNCDTQKV